MEKIIIHVGSESKHKVDAVRAVIKLITPGPVDVIGHPAKSGVSDQPYGMEETMCGALNRALYVWSPGQIAIGIEGGLVNLPDKFRTYVKEAPWLCMAVVCLMDRNSKTYFSTSAGMQFPTKDVDEAQKRGRTVGKILADKYGGDHTDPRAIISNDRVNRRDSIEEAVKLALLNIF